MCSSSPVCEACEKPLVWIGIGPGAEAVCVACSEVASGDRCPRCGSDQVEPFVVHPFIAFSSLGSAGVEAKHCMPCGKVFQ